MSRISCAQVAGRLVDRLAADGHRARAEGAAAVGHGVGVAGDHAHARHRHAQRRGGDLAHDGVGALALLGDADRADDAAVGLELDDAGVLQRDRRAADAVVAVRARRGALDEAGDADAAVDALARAARACSARSSGIAHALDQDVDAALVRQVLELDAAGGDGGIAVVGEDVAAAHLDRRRSPAPRAARSTRCSPTVLPIGWPTARYCEDGGLLR